MIKFLFLFFVFLGQTKKFATSTEIFTLPIYIAYDKININFKTQPHERIKKAIQRMPASAKETTKALPHTRGNKGRKDEKNHQKISGRGP